LRAERARAYRTLYFVICSCLIRASSVERGRLAQLERVLVDLADGLSRLRAIIISETETLTNRH